MDNNEILLIHLGGLGDVCLSESVFLSLRTHLGNCLVGLGNRRFLDLFSEYFSRLEGVESRKWLYLFSDKLTGPRWRRIVFMGKDREGILRSRWQRFSEEEIVFIDMYPESAFQGEEGKMRGNQPAQEHGPGEHIQAYQLNQLVTYGIVPLVRTIHLKKSSRVILYPEKGFTKAKWHPENFLALYSILEASNVNVVLLESPGVTLDVKHKAFFEELTETRQFFSEGGIFVSNDSGMAHLAGAMGLFTLTIFAGFNPAVWHPRGRNMSLIQGRDIVDPPSLAAIITQAVKNPEVLP